jgi:mannose-6-phosphate isomerase-like protein (cupin superfamily)
MFKELIANRKNIEPHEDPCGLMWELYHSDNMSIAYIEVTGRAKRHKHEVMEEIYYIEKGEGQLIVGDETLILQKGDIFSIPKNTWHYLNKIEDTPFEVLVVSHPRYNPDDFITED